MSDAQRCPICDEPLAGTAEVTPEGLGTTVVHDCPQCGRYAIPPDVAPLMGTLTSKNRFNLMARLETRSIRPAADGTVVLTPKELGVR